MANNPTTRIFWLVAAAVAFIGLGSFALSFVALYELATANGVPARLGWIWPLIVDVSMVIYTAAILVAQLQRRGAKLPVALTIFYGVVTIAGNILHAPHTALGWFVASLPPLSLIFGSEMLRAMAHHNITHRAAVQTVAELQRQAQKIEESLVKQSANFETQERNKRAVLAQLEAQIEQTQSQLEAAQNAPIDPKERQLWQLDGLLAAGLSQRAAAEVVGISESTLRNRIKNLNGDSLFHREGARS